MSEKERYKRFIEHMRSWVIGLPDSDILLPLIELRYSPEEAEFLSDFPFLPHTVEQLLEKLGIPADELVATLDPMAKKGSFFATNQGKRSAMP
ncbi:MAG: hypothetical protein QXH17_09370 [Candidatus Bathyarchaeia archaeon]